MKRTLFFATPADIVPVLRRFEANAPLKFVEMGNLTTPNRAIYLYSSAIPDPGVSTHESGSGSAAFLVTHRGKKNHMHTFVGYDGDKHWTLENSDNEESVVLTPAGLWKDILLPGTMDTLHTKNEVAQQLMRWFLSALRQEGFTKIERWWLGKEAFAMLESGKRLSTTAEQSPPQFDLRLPGRMA
jgi:hypothetical protein